jgi:DNA-directed RNA polymerase specialized sigma24 family protein
MSKQDSERPKGHFESNKASDNEDRNEEGSHKREKFAPAENERKLTLDDFKKFIASKDYSQLESYVKACCRKLSLSEVTADIIFSETLSEIEKAIDDQKVYESKFEGLRRTIAYRLIGREHKKLNGHASKDANKQHEITACPKRKTFEIEALPDRVCASPEVIASLKEAISKLSSRELEIFISDSENVKAAKIAATLGISKSNLRQIRYRAITRLYR